MLFPSLPLRFAVGALCLCPLAAPAPSAAQSIFAGDVSSEEVNRAADLEQARTDLASCAPHLSRLRGEADPRAFAESVDDPGCRKAILEAQAAGLSRAEIVDVLMGAGDAPDPEGLVMPHDGPPEVVD